MEILYRFINNFYSKLNYDLYLNFIINFFFNLQINFLIEIIEDIFKINKEKLLIKMIFMVLTNSAQNFILINQVSSSLIIILAKNLYILIIIIDKIIMKYNK